MLESRGGAFLIPPAPDVCQECAIKHESWQAHDRESLYYQYSFHAKHGRWPTWADAIAHCPPDVKQFWREELTKMGIKVGEVPEDA